MHHGEVVDDASVSTSVTDDQPSGSSVTHGARSAVGTVWATGIVRLALSQDAAAPRYRRPSLFPHDPGSSHDPRGTRTASNVMGGTLGSGLVPSEGGAMANKDKGGSKSSKTAATKSLKEKRKAKKEKAAQATSSRISNGR